MTEPKRDRSRVTTATVLRTHWLTPHMIRVVAGGPGIAGFAANAFTDAYVKLLFPIPGVEYPAPLDMRHVRDTYPRERWPVTRTYTVRAFDAEAGELTLDFVYHGDTGFAGPWAKNARPGTEFSFLGPGGAYAPGTDADWHLLAGDEAALPAIGAAIDALADGAVATAVIEVEDAREEQSFGGAGKVDVLWVHRSAGGSLVDAVRALEFADGRVQAFVHGETAAVKELRRHLLDERGVEKDLLSISGYWRRGMDEDAFQAAKKADRAPN
jgi:NADPH-dependent ferric siderophore reductase